MYELREAVTSFKAKSKQVSEAVREAAKKTEGSTGIGYKEDAKFRRIRQSPDYRTLVQATEEYNRMRDEFGRRLETPEEKDENLEKERKKNLLERMKKSGILKAIPCMTRS